jgi:hypothetical protein
MALTRKQERGMFVSESAQTQREHAYAVLDHMDVTTTFDACSSESTDQWSAGAVWCRNVWDAAREAWDQKQFDHESDRLDHDAACELADTLTPVYTHNRWSIFVDLTAYTSERADELCSEGDYADMTVMAGAVLESLARDAVMALVGEWRGELESDEDAV